MVLPLTTAAVALIYVGAIPVQIALRWQSGAGLGVGIALFEARFALRRVRKRSIAPKKPLPENLDFSAVFRSVRSLLRHVRLEGLRLTGDFGCDDATLTALICGGANALGCALHAGTKRVHIRLQPDFNAQRLHADISGMISVRIGYIMLAALLGLTEYISGRLQAWTSIPSKAL